MAVNDGPRVDDLAAASRGVGLESAFQPIVSLSDGSTFGYEALARWPDFGGLDPPTVFAHAEATGHLDTLDRLCVHSAIRGALAASLGRDVWVFVNAEPTSQYLPRAEDEMLSRGHAELQLIFEVTERHLFTHPAALLKKIAALRADGFGIALDDVDTTTESVTLIDVVAPDVIKLDMKVVQSESSYARLRTVAAIMDYQHRTGALLVAEGIETARHLRMAVDLGATLGQGYYLGTPRRLDPQRPARAGTAPQLNLQQVVADSSTPFDMLVAAGVEVRTERKDTLIALSRYLESHAAEAAQSQIVLAAVQSAESFTPATRRRYEDLAAKCPLVAVFGHGLRGATGPGIRGIDLDPGDPLSRQWIVLTLGPNLAAALIARERDPHSNGRGDDDRLFDTALTTEHAQVAAAARHLLSRVP